jgi:hypothetical protein
VIISAFRWAIRLSFTPAAGGADTAMTADAESLIATEVAVLVVSLIVGFSAGTR